MWDVNSKDFTSKWKCLKAFNFFHKLKKEQKLWEPSKINTLIKI